MADLIIITVLFVTALAFAAMAGYGKAMERWYRASAALFDDLIAVGRERPITGADVLDAWDRHMPGASSDRSDGGV